jgi:predicted TIM-barrel fold metal-dependent hydrolase
MEMTRRQLLALLPAAAAVRAVRGAAVSFERIDTHNHIHRSAPALVAAMEREGWRGLSICDAREIGDQPSILPEMIAGTVQFHRESKGRWAWATTFDARDFEKRDFAAHVIGDLERDFAREAIAVKIWKNVGMGIRARSGEYLLPDHPSLLPIYEAVQKAGKTLICHLAEPDGAWLPLDDPANTETGYLKNHPEWHMYGRPDAPSKETILAARDRVVARHPKLRVIGCHLGSNEEDLGRLAKRLDALPNFVVDVASRVRYLMAGDRAKTREFVLRYQDRLLYATDFTLGADEVRYAQSLQATHDREWNFFATRETVKARDREVQGLALPESVLRKIFRDNAVRWLPGILG